MHVTDDVFASELFFHVCYLCFFSKVYSIQNRIIVRSYNEVISPNHLHSRQPKQSKKRLRYHDHEYR